MEENTDLAALLASQELDDFPRSMAEALKEASGEMSSILDEPQLAAWAETGLDLARQAARSWEAATRYFEVSPEVARHLPANYFARWSDCGRDLCKESPTLASCFFESSPATMAKLRSRHIDSWARLGLSLYKGTWKSSALSCRFFQSSPVLLDSITVPDLERFVAFLETVSHRSYDLAMECLDLAQKIFPLLGEDREPFISLGASLAESSWRQVKSLFEASGQALPDIHPAERTRFLKLADSLRRSGFPNVPAAMLEVSRSLARLDRDNHARLLELAEGLMEISPDAVSLFIRSCPQALERVTMGQLEHWFQEGLRVLAENHEGGLAYFRLESAHSQDMLEGLSSSLEFGRIKDLIELYCRALAGAELKMAASSELAHKNIGWVSDEAPSTEGSTVYVPALVDRYPTKAENFAWFKSVSTHQVAHLEFGSFSFAFSRPSTLFSELRPQLENRTAMAQHDGPQNVDSTGLERAWVTDMHRFFNVFEDRKLALDVFTVVEDGRLDARIKAEYPGIKSSYVKVQKDSIPSRPEIRDLPMREAMVEFLVRLSLQQYEGLPVPSRYVDEARQVARIARRVLDVRAAVEDTAEATLRIYTIIAGVPNEQIAPEDWQDFDEEPDEDPGGASDEELLEQLMQGVGSPAESEGQQEYEPTQDVDFRGDFKPELVQLLTEIRNQGEDQNGDAEGEAISQEMIEELLKNSAELDLQEAGGEVEKVSGTFADNMLKEAGANMSSSESGQGPFVHVDEEGGPLDPAEPQTFVYDEWDFRADDYKPAWCIVRQRGMAEGDPSYFGTTLHSYGSLVSQVRRQFEMMVPEDLRKVQKLEDGEEIDIDDVIEAFVDIRTGVGPSEKLYWKRNKVQRDVACIFLLDTSASTAEAIEDTRKISDDWEAPKDPVEYMVWLRTRRGEGPRRSYKRIIDLEKEAVVLLIHSLEAIGDEYGIYGFSGYGRENVEFYTIKDIDERFSEQVKGRIDHISPLHATRMGPAIRHATSKLEKQEARTKLLFLISDGRPQDRGYSREGVEKEYAVHDTKMALDEAKGKDINAFCLTVDKNGHDYLKTMCQDMGYEVLDDIYSLPQRLLYLYRRLTM